MSLISCFLLKSNHNRDVINFVSYIHVVYSYNNINFTYLYMHTNYLRHLVNIVDILWSRPV